MSVPQKYEFNVEMACCSGAVDRALKKVNGISAVDISLQSQTVKVDATTATYEDVETAIKKTGKKIKSGKVIKQEEKPTEKPTAPAVVA